MAELRDWQKKDVEASAIVDLTNLDSGKERLIRDLKAEYNDGRVRTKDEATKDLMNVLKFECSKSGWTTDDDHPIEVMIAADGHWHMIAVCKKSLFFRGDEKAYMQKIPHVKEILKTMK